MSDTLTLGRKAIERHDWDTALEALIASDEQGELSPDDLRMLGDAYWWSAQPDEAVKAYERAFSGHLNDDEITQAAYAGAVLAYFALRRQNDSIAGAWISRVEGLLEDQPVSAGHAWLMLLYTAFSLFVQVDLDQAIERGDEAIRIGKELRIPGVQSLAMSFKATALIQKGDWREGVALIDQSTVVAMSEGSDLRAASDVYCQTIAACADLGDFRRAGEWTEEAERWMGANSVGGYTGVCEVHRAELKRFRGSWSEAEETARKACIELEKFRILDGIGFARYEIGEVRRRMGDLEAAEQAFQEAYEYGHPAQPGYALLLLDKGDVEAAAQSIKAALDRGTPAWTSNARLGRARLLPAQIEIAIAAGDLGTAHESLEELQHVSEDYDSSLWKGYALACEGSLKLNEGNLDEALDALNRSWLIWRDSDMPYESAQARTQLGIARRAAGDEAGAAREFKAARSVFERLGAARDLEQLRKLTGEAVSSGPAGARVTKSFMFTDIVTSTDLIALIGDAAWENLLKWHDRTLREAFEAHGGEEVRHTGDGFFIAFSSPRSAIECGVAIQRRLEKHRRDHGFAPWVRIGIHHAEASREQGDYAGGGVHVAARIGDTAEREEVLVSDDVLDAAGRIPYQSSEPRQVTLKGVSEPVAVRSIEWRQ
jgi:class 3 adenylate cyclase